MDFRSERVEATILDPRRGFEPTVDSFEVRWDPLTGHTARLLSKSNLLPPSDFDLEQLARDTREGCFFCPEKVSDVTPKLPPDIWPDGRIRQGQALLFPNIQPYAKHSSVAIYGPDLHYLPLERMSPEVVTDNLAVQLEFVRAVLRADPASAWASVSANHMLPSGSSLFHPHTQAAVDPHATTMQGLLAQVSADVVRDYVETEKRLGARHLGSGGRVEWLAAFAPVGFNEIRAFVPGLAGLQDVDADLLAELGRGLSAALAIYAELGFQSFNWAIYGRHLNLRLVTRSNLKPLYRSDAAYFERLHWQGMVDTSPEELAEKARGRFS